VREEVLRAAAAVDRVIGSLSEELLEAIAKGGESWAYDRGPHRQEHIKQIERFLAP